MFDIFEVVDEAVHVTAEVLDDPDKTDKAAVEVAEVVSVVSLIDGFFD